MQIDQFHVTSSVEMHHWWCVARRQIVRALIHQIMPPSRKRTIVDVGCGTGGNIALLANEYHCIAIEPSRDALRYADTRSNGVHYICGQAPQDLGDMAQQADLFLLMDVLEHVPDDFELLSRLLAAARPGARLLITVPADPALWSRHDEVHGHYRRYDLCRLQRLWSDLPVAVELLSYFNSRLYPIIRMIRKLNRLRGTSYGHAGTDLKMPNRLVNGILRHIFQGEGKLLTGLHRGSRTRGYRRGTSLIAILRRGDQPIHPRRRPADVMPDTCQVAGSSSPELHTSTV